MIPMEITKITSKHQATIPAEVRAALGLRAGDAIEWVVGDDGAARVRKAGCVDWALMRVSEDSFAQDWLSSEDEEAWRDL